MGVKINDKDIADVKIGDSQISSIYAGDVLVWESGYPKFCGTINWNESPFTLYNYTGTKVDKPDYNFKLGAPNTLTGLYYFTNTRTDQINAVTELIINPDYVEFDYSRSGWGLHAFSLGLTKLTFTKPFKTIIINTTRNSLGLSKCKEIYGLDFGGSTIKSLWGFYSSLNITTGWDFLDTANYEPTRMDECFSSSNIDQVDFSKSNWDISKCNSFSNCFSGCKSLTKIKGFNSYKTITTSFTDLFYNDANLESLEDCHFNSDSCTSLYRMFSNCSKLTNVGDFSNMTLNNANCNAMFQNCTSLISPITLKGSISSAQNMFNSCLIIENIDLSELTLNSTNFYYAFYKCPELKSVALKGGTITNAAGMFNSCSSITTITSTNDIVLNGADCTTMFANCSGLMSIPTLKGSVSNANSMFYGCSKLTGIDISNVDFSNCTNMVSMFYSCPNLETIGTRTLDTSSATNMSNMFFSCGKLLTSDYWTDNYGLKHSYLAESVKVTSKCTNISYLLPFLWGDAGCVDISDWDTTNVTSMTNFMGAEVNVIFGSGFFNTNIPTIPLNSINWLNDRNGQWLTEMFNILRDHPKTEDPDWEGQTIRFSGYTWNNVIYEKNGDGQYTSNAIRLQTAMGEAEDSGWMFASA